MLKKEHYFDMLYKCSQIYSNVGYWLQLYIKVIKLYGNCIDLDLY